MIHQPRNFSVAIFLTIFWDMEEMNKSMKSVSQEGHMQKGTSFMLAQVEQVIQSNGVSSARQNPSGHLPKSLFYPFRATGTLIGNPDNEYRVKRRHRRRLSKNPGTLHCP
jgi:hypothetical protein